jgi:hypothetical protein
MPSVRRISYFTGGDNFGHFLRPRGHISRSFGVVLRHGCRWVPLGAKSRGLWFVKLGHPEKIRIVLKSEKLETGVNTGRDTQQPRLW